MPDRTRYPADLDAAPRFAWTKRKTLPTAVWRRSTGDLRVVRLDPLPATFFADIGSEVQFTGPGAMYRLLGQIAALCWEPNVVLWIPSDQPAAKERKGTLVKTGGALVVAPKHSCALSLKEWRRVRGQLHFLPKRWNLPATSELEAFSNAIPPYIDIYRGKACSDGHTFLLSLCPAGLRQFVSVCWHLGNESDQYSNDYRAEYFVEEDKRSRLRLVRWTPRSEPRGWLKP